MTNADQQGQSARLDMMPGAGRVRSADPTRGIRARAHQAGIKVPRLLAALGLALTLSAPALAADAPAAAAPQYQDIDIDHLVTTARPAQAGTRTILVPSPVRFNARIKQGPRKRQVEYLYTALGFFPLDPRPQVSHQMFVETPGGHILPVYVDDSQVAGLEKLGEGAAVILTGWHVYNYSKGPAILVVGFERAPLAMLTP